MSKNSRRWLWPTLGIVAGLGCGWAWRMGSERGVAASAPSADQVSAAQELEDQKTPVPQALNTSAVKTKPPPPPVNVCEAELRKALAGGPEADVKKWAVELAKQNGVLALRILLDSKSPHREAAITAALNSAGGNDPTGVTQLCREHTELLTGTGRMMELFTGMARRSHEQALAIYALKDDHWPLTALIGIARGWSRRDWKSSVTYGMMLGEGKERRAFIDTVMEEGLRMRFGEVAVWLRTLSPAAIGSLGIDWKQARPATLEEYGALREIAPASYLKTYGSEVAKVLNDLLEPGPAADAWLHSLPPGATREAAWEAYAIKAGSADPGKLASLLGETSDSVARTRVTSAIAGLMAYDNPQAALAYADGLGDAHAREMARRTAMGVISVIAPERAIQTLLATEGAWPRDQMTSFGYIISEHAPDVIAAAAPRLRDASTAEDWMKWSINLWSHRDPAGAAQWIGQLPAGAARDHASHALAINIAHSSPEQAMEWAQSMYDARLRSEAILQVAQAWEDNADGEYRTWLAQQSTLDAALRLKLEAVKQRSRTGYFGGISRTSNAGGVTIITQH